MPVLLDRRKGPRPPPEADLEIGLVNNMPDAALDATERQFVQALEAGSDGVSIRLRLFSLPSVPRAPEVARGMASRYASIRMLEAANLDGLIVTGTEPRAPDLADEPYWDELRALVAWAEQATLSTLWSCLAAHAAVLALDGIRRRPYASKCSGVFTARAEGERWSALAQEPLLVCHSRWNDVAETDLAAAGYTILSRSEGAGVDLFTREARSLFVFMQGHPEYGPDALGREFRRDLGRYLAGERETCPAAPLNYLAAGPEAVLAGFRQRALHERSTALLAELPPMDPRPGLPAALADSRARLYRAWIAELAGRKAARDGGRGQQPRTASSV